ncbi:hypothetical protein RSO01_90890 [Reyranella soli]|uniref:Chemotaxis methyl-accepting receptor HlyB-like 4HB MCP domain-containing protein n=2 Tax=Reyranella soli TaxID=1230389 RepID=A0A512NSK0_9HYPH|nr:hypothetical protein RSO01_90890 [Reyranella soli]
MMTSGNAPAKVQGPSTGRVFLPRLLVALLFAAPSIGSWFSSNVIYLRIDELERPLKQELVTLRAGMSDLERFVAQFQANELGRGTLNLLMTAVAADVKLRYLGDNLYRANAASIGSLRRAAAIVYPKNWQAVLKPYEETIAQGYDSPTVVQQLQAFENKLIADALSTITRDQERINALTATHERYERWRGFIASTLAYLAVALSIALFVFRLQLKPS